MNRTCISLLTGLSLLVFSCNLPSSSNNTRESSAIPRIFLSNGWALTPVGEHLPLGDFPLQLAFSPDEQVLVATNNGYGAHSLTLVDAVQKKVLQEIPIPKAWYGLAWAPDGRRLYASGGFDNCVRVFDYVNGKLQPRDSIALGKPWPADSISPAGMAVDAAGNVLYAVSKDRNPSLFVVDLALGKVRSRLPLPSEGYTCLLSKDQQKLYLSLWGGSAVLVYDVPTGKIESNIQVGSHPNEMVLSPGGKFLYVACADDNSVAVVNLATKQVIETITTSLYPMAPTGSTANSLALTPDGRTLYVANADNNCLAVFDLEKPGKSVSEGFIPTGWYPTSVRVSKNTLFVANGKGNTGSRPNPQGPNPTKPKGNGPDYIAGLFKGSLSYFPAPSAYELGQFTRLTYENTPYSKDKELRPAGEYGNPIPMEVGKPSPIRYVFYVIKENRTYDQVFGDMPEGNGDPALCIFPDSVTPNKHALARTFTLFDNFYVDAEVSADGHNWSTAAYANDYVEKTWPTNYGAKGGTYDYEGSRKIAHPRDGYLWDHAGRKGISYRTYGEFANLDQSYLESLKGHTSPRYPGYNLNIRDEYRFEQWRIDFDSLLQLGQVPRLNIIRLPNDHTAGARGGAYTPLAMVADNDQAVGRLVEHISHSPLWKEAAIFILEDDAQNGSDHVDAHRSPVLVISPYVRRGHVEHTMYSTASVLRTMELILGIPPMSQYDAAARPMYACFTKEPDFTSYQHVAPKIALDSRNAYHTRLSDASYAMNLDKEDQAPDLLLNQLIWQTIRGEKSVMPPPRRAAFVRIAETEDDED